MPLPAWWRRRPWLPGVVLLLLALGLATPALLLVERRGFAVFAGVAALLLLALGSLERLWQTRPLPGRRRSAARSRLRLVAGGKTAGKRNGEAQDPPGTTGGDGPGWVM